MKTLAIVTTALGLLAALAAANPAVAAIGQCFDAWGRPVGPPHDTDDPPYGLICQVYRQGGQCTHVQPQWAISNCGLAPRGYYNRGNYDDYESAPRYRSRRYDYHRDYDRGHRRGETPRGRQSRQHNKSQPSGQPWVQRELHIVPPQPRPPSDAR